MHLVEVLQRGCKEQLGRHRNGLQLGFERGQQQPAQRKEQQHTTNGEESYLRFIKPHTIFKDTFSYYCFISYEKRNNEKVGELRSFRFDKIGEIKPRRIYRK